MADPQYQQLPDEPTNKTKAGVAIGIAVCLLVLGCLGATYVYSSSPSSLHITFPPHFAVQQRMVLLGNGLEVVLVADPQASKSAAAMSVAAGQFSDGEVPGLAHFVEHLLFIGSGRYPEKGYFMGLVNENGGRTNAFTASEGTVFLFDVKTEAFEKVLDVFSGFFTSPLFPESRVQDEIKAVNSEYENTIFQDSYRMQRLLQVLASPDHPFSGFHIGSIETLANVTKLHEKAKNFRDKNYVAGNMRLVLYGNHTLAHMEAWANLLFAEVPRGQVESAPPQPLYNSTGHLALTTSITPGHTLILVWTLEAQYADLEAQPVDFLAFLLNNQGPGGLRQGLMTEGLVLDAASGLLESVKDGSLLYVELTLSESGFVHWEDAIKRVLAYIAGLRNSVKSDLQKAWSHFKAKKLTDFNYGKDFSAWDIVESIGFNMLTFPPEQYLAGFDLQDTVDLAKFREGLKFMTLENCIGVFMSSTWTKGDTFLGEKIKFSQSEHFYDISYDLFAFPETLVSDELELTPFLPTATLSSDVQIAIQTCPDCASIPTPLFSSKSLQIWHSFDISYNRPCAYLSLFLPSPASASSQVLTRLYAAQLKYLFQEKSAQWGVGVNIEVFIMEGSKAGRGLVITISAPNTLIFNATKAALAVIPPSSNSYFALLYEDLKAKLDNKGGKQPYELASAYLKRLIVAGNCLDSELLAALEEVKLGEVEEFYREVVNTGNAIVLVSGNIDLKETTKVADILKEWADSRHSGTYPAPSLNEISGSYVYQEVLTPSSTHAVINWYSLSPSSNSLLAAAKVLNQFFRYGAFDELRNKQQLGYLVDGVTGSAYGHLYLMVIIQGGYQPPHVMDARIEEFLISYNGKLETLTETDLNNAKDSVLNALQVGPETLQNWHYQTLDFLLQGEDVSLNTLLIPYVHSVTKDDLKRLLALAHASQSEISVQVYMEDSKISPSGNRTRITDFDYFA